MAWDYEGGAVMYDYSEFWVFLVGTIVWALTTWLYVVIKAKFTK